MSGERCTDPSSCSERFACQRGVSPQEAQLEITPKGLAEKVCLYSLRDHYKGRRRSAYKDDSKSMSYHLEAALADPEEDYAQDHFTSCRDLLDSLLTEDYIGKGRNKPAVYAEALILRAQLPVFQERRSIGYIPEHVLISTHKKIVKILGDAIYTPSKLTYDLRPHQITELEVMGLLSRRLQPDKFPYLSLAREERHPKYASLNHDIYTIQDSRKTPIQIKTSAREDNTQRYDSSVLILTREELAGCVDNLDIDHKTIAELLTREAGFGEKPAQEEKWWLTAMSDHYANRIDAHRRKQTTLQ